MNAVADTLALMHLLAVPRFDQAANSRNLRVFVLPETAHDIRSYSGHPISEQMHAMLDASIRNGTLEIMDIRSAAHPDLYCQLVPALQQVTARTVLLAHHQQAVFVTESPKLLGCVGELLPGLRSTTGLSVVRQWMDEGEWSEQERTAFIRDTALYAQPTRAHPLDAWWRARFTAAQDKQCFCDVTDSV